MLTAFVGEKLKKKLLRNTHYAVKILLFASAWFVLAELGGGEHKKQARN